MKYKFFSALFLVEVFMLMGGCHSHDLANGGHTHDDSTHSHTTGPNQLEPLSFTVWTKKSELFVEFPPLIIGIESRFAAHFSEMKYFKAIEDGEVLVRLKKGDQVVTENRTSAPASPGIFRPTLTAPEAGNYDLEFILTTSLLSDTITISGITIYPNEASAIAANPLVPKRDEIPFLKEQTWKIDFAIEQVKRQAICEVIHTSGEILPVKGEEKIIAAKSSGIVFIKSKKLQEGREVRKGETLFTINSNGLLKSNIEEKFRIAKARSEKTKKDFERAEKLLKEQIIGQKEYERRKMDYAIADAEFQTLSNSYNTVGQSVNATMSGIIKNVFVSDGQFVEEGKTLIEITRNRRLILQAEVSQSYLPKLRLVKSANFKTPYMGEMQSIEDYNGKLVSYGKIIEKGSNFIPIAFELDNLHDLIPGSFIELFLLTNPIDKEIVIPKSALMQDYNLNYVYVQTGGESFEKREVKLGVDDGFNVQILSGVSEEEWVVTKGAYQIKMASMSSTIPAHGHAH